MDKQLRILFLLLWLLPNRLIAQQSFDNLIYWTQKKMLRTDMPITLNGVYFGNDLAKNLIYNSPVFKNYAIVYKPFSGTLPFGSEGAQGQMILYSYLNKEQSIKFSGSSIGEANIKGQTYYLLKKKHQIILKGNIYNQSFSSDRNKDKSLDLPYRINSHFSVTSNFRLKKKTLQIILLNLNNREQSGLDIAKNLGNKYSTSDSLSPFTTFQNQTLSTFNTFFTTPLKVKKFWIYAQDISSSFQFKHYRESSILGINPYQAQQTSYLVSSTWNGSYLKGFKSAVIATLKHNTANEKLHNIEYNRLENSAALGFELDKYWKKGGMRNNRVWKNHIHSQWRTEYNSLVGWINSPGLRFDKDFKILLVATVYEKNQRLPFSLSENRDWLMSNRKLVLDKPKLEQSDKFGLVLDNFKLKLRRQNWQCQANIYYILTKNKWVAELNHETNEIKLYSNPNLVSDKQFYFQLSSPSNNKIYNLFMSYRYDDIRNTKSGNNKSTMLIPAHTAIFNFNLMLPHNFFMNNSQFNIFRNLNFNLSEMILGSQKTAFNNRTSTLFLTNLSLEFTRQLFSFKEIYTPREHFFYSLGIENLFNQTQNSLLLGLDQNSSFKGFNSYGPTIGRRFTFSIRFKIMSKGS